MKSKVIMFLLLLLVLGSSSIFSTSVERQLRIKMDIMDDLYMRFVTSHYNDSKIKQRLLTELPDLIKKLKSHTPFFSSKAARYENMLRNIKNWGKTTGGGNKSSVIGTGGKQKITTGQTNIEGIFEIRIVDPQGNPIDGSYVSMDNGQSQLCANGTIVFKTSAGRHTFRISAKKFVGITRTLNVPAGGTISQTLQLQPAPTLTVKVRDASGQDLQGISNVIKLYKDGKLWKEARGSSYTFSDLAAGTYQAEASAAGYPISKSHSITYSGYPPNWHQALTIQLPMRIKVFIREFGKVDLIPGAYASMNNGPYQFCPTGTASFPVYNLGLSEFRAKAIAHAEVIKRFKIDQLTAYQEIFIDLFPAPTLMVEVRGASGQLLKGANITISLFKDDKLVKSVKGPYYLFSDLEAGCTYHALANSVGLPAKKSKGTRWTGNPFGWHDTLVIRY